MRYNDSRKNVVMVSLCLMLTIIALVSCEKRDDLDSLLNIKYSKTIAFSQIIKETRATYNKLNNQFPETTFVLCNEEEGGDSLFLMSYVSDMDSELLTRADVVDNVDAGFNIIAVDAEGNSISELNKAVSKSGNEWHYNPEQNWSVLSSKTVQFYGHANIPTTGVTPVPGSATKYQFDMFTNSSAQKDVIVAKAANTYNSSSNAVVPLTFNHIFAGVRFEVGDFDANVGGNITAIRIEGLVGVGTYDMATNSWSGLSAENQKTFNVDGIVTGNQTKGTQVGSTLMVIPGALGSNAKIVITLKTKNTKDRTLTASLAGGSFEAGKLYTCKINTNEISYLAFANVPQVVDAHYVIAPVDVYLQSSVSSATLTAKIGNTKIEMTQTLNEYEGRGYWIDNESLKNVGMTQHKSGSISISRSSDGYSRIYLFIPENISSSNRNITLTLSASGADNQTATISQFCPTATGCERIEEDPFQPWGPYWEFEEGTNEVVYQIDPNSEGYNDLKAYMFYMYVNPLTSWFFQDLLGFETIEGVTPEGTGSEWFNSRYTLTSVKVNYEGYLAFETTEGGDGAGLTNTKNVFNGSGGLNISQLLEIEEMLSDAVAKDINGDPILSNEPIKKDFENSAIIGSVKKNRFILKEEEGVVVLACPNELIKWHLPSISEIPNKLQYKGEIGESQLSGTYWSSSTSSSNLAKSHSKVYIWPTAGTGTVIDEKRDVATHKYRAVRVVGDGSTFQNQTN